MYVLEEIGTQMCDQFTAYSVPFQDTICESKETIVLTTVVVVAVSIIASIGQCYQAHQDAVRRAGES